MRTEEEIAQLKKELAEERAKTTRLEGELARERAENAHLRQMMEAVLRRLGEVEGKLARESHNSSKPPSSDGLGRKRTSLSKRSEKKPGGQARHRGHKLKIVEPDKVVRHRPVVCQHCQHALAEVAGRVREWRPVHDPPEMRPRVCEHQVEGVPCPQVGQQSVGCFPAEVKAPVQYGPNVQALAAYLHQGQFVPMARTCDVLDEVCGCPLS